jgi:hypothetical protein
MAETAVTKDGLADTSRRGVCLGEAQLLMQVPPGLDGPGGPRGSGNIQLS